MKTFLGIDGGGTHTRAVLVDQSGYVLGTGAGGTSNYQTAGIEQTRQSLKEALEGVASQAPATALPPSTAFLGMAGVVSASDRQIIVPIARELGVGEHIEVDHDIRIALAGGGGGAEAIALIAGTGSSCYGRREDGRSWRAGGWGHILDDRGSGYWIGVQGLTAVTRAADGRGIATSLSEPMISALDISQIDEILSRTGTDGLTRSEIASLAPIVIAEATEGDSCAKKILLRGAGELAMMVEAVATRLDWIDRESGRLRVPVIATGGLTDDRFYRDMIEKAIRDQMPEAAIGAPLLPPHFGAALLAMAMAGISTTEKILAMMQGGK